MIAVALAAGVIAMTTPPTEPISTSPGSREIVTDVIESLGLAEAQQQCMLDRLDGYTDDQLQVIANENEHWDPATGDTLEGASDDLRSFVTDLEACADPEFGFDTAISAAVAACEQGAYEDHAPGAERFTVMDDGHSVRIQDFAEEETDGGLVAPRVECLADQLGLPEWIFVHMAFVDASHVDVPGYTVAWKFEGDDDSYSVFLIYDSEVGGGR